MKHRWPLYPPDDYDVVDWLARYDNSPRILPRWPQSLRLALVAVLVVGDAEYAAEVLTHPDAITAALEHPGRKLFFQVPRSVVLNETRCPGLTSQAFYQPEP